MTLDPWQRVPVVGEVRLRAVLPGQNLATLHAVALARMAGLREHMLAPCAVHAALAAAIERRDDAARAQAQREIALAEGRREIAEISACFAQLDRDGVLVAPAWAGEAYAAAQIGGAALARWQLAAGARLERLLHAVRGLEAAQPALQAEAEQCRAARIAALARKLMDQHGYAWSMPPGPECELTPPGRRAALLLAGNAAASRVTLRWAFEEASGAERLEWSLADGATRLRDAAEGAAAVETALAPVSLAA
jgi:hypothetical protein